MNNSKEFLEDAKNVWTKINELKIEDYQKVVEFLSNFHINFN